MKKYISSILAVLIVLSFSSNLSAAGGQSFGARGGYDFDGEQVVFGFQAELGRFLELAKFAPSADYGFGNDQTTFAFNGDIRVFITPPKSSTTLYGGVGPTFFVLDSEGRDADSEFGLTISGGVKFSAGKGRHYNLEGRFGMDKMPDFRLLFGMFF